MVAASYLTPTNFVFLTLNNMNEKMALLMSPWWCGTGVLGAPSYLAPCVKPKLWRIRTVLTKLSPSAQKVMNAYKQRTLATKRSTAVIGVLQEIVNQLETLKPPTSLQRTEEKLCHSIGVNECGAHILNIIIELCDSND